MTFFRLLVGLLFLTSTFSVYAKGDNNGNDKLFDEQQFHQVLLAEFYNQTEKPKLTLHHYLPIALNSDDPALLKRVTEIATGSSQLKKGLQAAKHWARLSPKSLEAQQYLALLLLRDGQLKQSATQLHFIRQIVDADSKQGEAPIISKGLKFVGALLVIESHHEKAYRVYNYYLKQLREGANSVVKYSDQRQLILASLAMKATEYAAVISALDSINIAGSEHFASAAIMKTKALRKLGKIEEAVKLLRKIVRTEKTSDSLRLQLTRLLISLGKKSEATAILESLSKKHPNNNDLLKALVALNISQKDWSVAKRNNNKLSKSIAYQNEADYFKGEIFEGEGDLKRALLHYKKVKKGVFLKSSYSKRAKVLAQIDGIEVSQQWIQGEQKKVSKKKDSAYWLKLEADLLADNKLSGSLRSHQKNLEAAITLYNQVISLVPEKTNYRYHRGLLFERTNQIVRAENDFTYVIKRRKNPASALNALGFLLMKHTKRLDEAKRYIKKAYALKPNDPMIIDSLGWLYFRTGDVKKAEIYLRKAYKDLKTPEVASHLITVLSTLEKTREAKQVFNQMIKIYPNNALLDDMKGSLGHI